MLFTCWHDLLLAEAARCAKAARELLTAALADCKEDFVLAQVQAEEKGKTAASKAKAVAGVNDKFAEPLSRLESAAALLGEVERLAAAGQWTPLYDKLTPYVLGMEEMPGFKGMKKRLTGDHKAAVRTRADEAAKLFEHITELVSCSEEEAEADRQAALPRLQACLRRCGISMLGSRPKSGTGSCWSSVTLSIRPSACSVTRTAPPLRCAGSSGRTTPP